jgi:hypothetical protein
MHSKGEKLAADSRMLRGANDNRFRVTNGA